MKLTSMTFNLMQSWRYFSHFTGCGCPNAWLCSFTDVCVVWRHGILNYDYTQRVADSKHCRLRSSSSSQLVIRRTRLSTVGDCAFPVTRSRLWNSLPPDVTSAPTPTTFRNRLKIYLFSRSFPS